MEKKEKKSISISNTKSYVDGVLKENVYHITRFTDGYYSNATLTLSPAEFETLKIELAKYKDK